MRKLLAVMLCTALLSGCSWFRNEPMNNNGKPNGNNTGNNNGMNSNNGSNGTNGNNANGNTPNGVNGRKGNIEDVLGHFQSKGIEAKNMSEIEQFDFAAHEGRMFEVSGETVYLYRLNTADEKMGKWMEEIKANKKVTVNNNGEDLEYTALINGDYLLIYPMDANVNELDKIFNEYTMK